MQCAVRCGCPTGLAFPHPSVPCIASLFLSRTRSGRLAFASSRHWLFPELLLLLLLCRTRTSSRTAPPTHHFHPPDLCSSSSALPLLRHISDPVIHHRVLILLLHSTPPGLVERSPTYSTRPVPGIPNTSSVAEPLCRLRPDIRQGPAVGSHPPQLLSSPGALHSARTPPDGKGPLTHGTRCSLRGSADSVRS